MYIIKVNQKGNNKMKTSTQMVQNKEYWYNHWSGDMANMVVMSHSKIKMETLYRYGKPVSQSFTYDAFDKFVEYSKKV